MVNAEREFAARPPKEELLTPGAIVRDFSWRYAKTKRTDQVIRWCRKAPNYATAVRRAVEARGEDGKHHNHQSKVDITARRKLGATLVSPPIKKRVEYIVSIKDNPAAETNYYTAFDALHDMIDEVKPFGIGPVTVYDVAVRVGEYLGIRPASVYVHAGVREGIKELEQALLRQGPMTVRAQRLVGAHKLPRVPMYLFPGAFKAVDADTLEDILCTYREVFKTWEHQ